MEHNQNQFAERLVLEDVPPVHFFQGGPRCPEDICFPSVMRALMEYLGETDYGCKKCRAKEPACKIPCSYAFFCGVSGAAFFLSWKDGWHGDNVAPFYLDADPAAMEKRSFQAIGYRFDLVMPAPGNGSKQPYLQAIDASLRRGLPAISYGIIGPPEPGLIAGYDEGGEVLLGWNFFVDMEPGIEKEPSGYYRKRDWAQGLEALLVVGEKTSRPALKEIYRIALENALATIRTPMVRPESGAPEWYQRRHNGLAAYTAWAEHLLQDEDFPPGDNAVLQQRYQVHNNVVGSLAEARWYGSRFLIGMTDGGDDLIHWNAIEDLYHAAGLYAGEHALMWKVWDLAGGIDNPQAWRKFADPVIRRQMASIILEAGEKDARAAEHLENVLAKMN
jgi:hypothetical protein